MAQQEGCEKMAEKLEINTSALYADIREIENSIAILESESEQMFDEIVGLNATWKGQANAAYNEQFRTDYGIICEMLKELRQYVNELYEADKAYNRCEEQVGELVRNIRI